VADGLPAGGDPGRDLIEFGITLGLACIAFWTGRSAMSINTVMQVSFVIQRYPVDMYGAWFRVFVTCVVPVLLINYYPAKFLLGKVAAGTHGLAVLRVTRSGPGAAVAGLAGVEAGNQAVFELGRIIGFDLFFSMRLLDFTRNLLAKNLVVLYSPYLIRRQCPVDKQERTVTHFKYMRWVWVLCLCVMGD